jgi:hypothetical protein
MTDDQLQRAWHFKQLKWSLQGLARAGAPQPTLFPEESNPDDLAFAFDHWAGLVQDAYGAELSKPQVAALEAICSKLGTMSRDGTEFEVELWTEVALATTGHWADVRGLASSALEAFGWTGPSQIDGLRGESDDEQRIDPLAR